MSNHIYTIQNIEQALFKLIGITGWEFNSKQATNDEIASYEKKYNLSFPPELKEWLKHCNGVLLDDGWFDIGGVNQSGDDALEIYEYSNGYNEEYGWRKNDWITLSQDGFGSYHILDGKNCINGKYPVYFIDQCDFDSEGNSKPTYIAASGLYEFLYFFIEQEIREQQICKTGVDLEVGYDYVNNQWPFNEQYVLKHDPDILKVKLHTGINLPWEA